MEKRSPFVVKQPDPFLNEFFALPDFNGTSISVTVDNQVPPVCTKLGDLTVVSSAKIGKFIEQCMLFENDICQGKATLLLLRTLEDISFNMVKSALCFSQV
ncbi:hypothetical protein B2J93_5117 [Marssonina coronariae]|uniref:Uncharacterized protein n=1 Tax=Diplocarpon coronariae TaxID=2795749 RepID=A0A218ZF76_9HELO|nr:hypothetical protein B2J93_5117 [Marssonina coronariae]